MFAMTRRPACNERVEDWVRQRHLEVWVPTGKTRKREIHEDPGSLIEIIQG